MKYATLNTDMSIPMLGLGTYALRGAECERCVLEALELGYRLFDTAQMYGNEREVGEGVRASGVPEDQVEAEAALPTAFRQFWDLIDNFQDL